MLHDIKKVTDQSELVKLKEDQLVPLIYIKDTAYTLNPACYLSRYYEQYLEHRKLFIATEARNFLVFEEEPMYQMYSQERNFLHRLESRAYTLQTESNLHKQYLEQRLYALYEEGRHYQAYKEGVYCSVDLDTYDISIMRDKDTPIKDYNYFYQGKLQAPSNGLLTLK